MDVKHLAMRVLYDWNRRFAGLLCLALAMLVSFSGISVDAHAAGNDRKQSASESKPSKKKKTYSKKSSTKSVSKASGKKKGRPARAAAAKPDDDQELHLNVNAAFLMNMKNGKVYYAHDADERIPPASITKVLTLYLVRDAMAKGRLKPDTPIPVSSLAIRTGGSTMSLYKGEKVPLSELIKGISVVSANNACVAVAEYMGKGDSRRFVAQMNAKAKSLGMTRSTFKNPNGLPAAGQYSTARDIAKLSASYLKRYPESLAIHSMTTHTYHGATHRNANSLLGRYNGVDGLKTGFVCASGYNITATAKRGDTRLIAVVLGARNPIVREVETARLLEYGFRKAAQEKPAPVQKKKKDKPSKTSTASASGNSKGIKTVHASVSGR
ncbi:MAG: D-alanyl-D-alanine carboxypeptidase family protein [Thermodesulfobacteriota bacterium]